MSGDAVEALAETLSWTSGDMTRWFDHAVPDHNRWSWRGDGHGQAMRNGFRDQARALLNLLPAHVAAEVARALADGGATPARATRE